MCLIKIISKKHSKKNWKAENQALWGIIIENIKQTLKNKGISNQNAQNETCYNGINQSERKTNWKSIIKEYPNQNQNIKNWKWNKELK